MELNGEALGLIETRGLVGAIEAADAAVKAAEVRLMGYDKVGGALVTILLRGDVAAVKSAVEAGAEGARRVGELISAHVIPRPHGELETLLRPDVPLSSKSKGSKLKKAGKGKKSR